MTISNPVPATRYVALVSSRCRGCWRCVEACARSVIGKLDQPGQRNANIVAGADCIGCGACLRACPAGAIQRRGVGARPRALSGSQQARGAVGMEVVADRATERLLPTTCSPTADERATVQEEPPGAVATASAASRRWNQRAFVALVATAAGLAVVISVGWIVVHVAMGVLLVVFCTWHAVLNRRALLHYLRNKDSRNAFPAREAIAAFALVGAVFAFTLVRALFWA